MGDITLDGVPVRTSGSLPRTGTRAPDFRLVARDLTDVSLADWRGWRKVLSIVPSLDTGVCQASTRAFDRRMAARSDAVLLTISADLPFAQSRFCHGAGLANVVTLSTMRGREFATDYGVLMVDGPMAGLCARAVVVLDEDDGVLHSELVPEIAREPDYDAALAALG